MENVSMGSNTCLRDIEKVPMGRRTRKTWLKRDNGSSTVSRIHETWHGGIRPTLLKFQGHAHFKNHCFFGGPDSRRSPKSP
ncbi:hypothetical protein JTE90_020638 [Oedothorax gibbosus]|uniref:Uncharacterized protein n=1 Tax=Oedothorax gibbosus TaxID=931172 RepID=A0AAV6TT23_9ARAC|nr:hypothetical protein JTE90_020638 [Oedothorax gibbosus]